MPEEKVVNLGGTIEGFPVQQTGSFNGGNGVPASSSVSDIYNSIGKKPVGRPSISINSFYTGDRYESALPGTDTEEMAAQQQSSGAKWVNAIGKMAGTATGSFVSGTAGLVYGIGKAAYDGKFSSLYNNEVTQSMDEMSKYLEDALPNYYTAKEKNADWWSPDNLFTANFWADKVLKNIGYSAGALAGGVAWSSLFKAIGLTNQLVKSGKALELVTETEKAMTAVPRIQQYAAMQNTLTSLGKKFLQGPASSILKSSDRILTSAMGTFGEASLEALQNMNDFRQKAIEEYKATYGEAPTGAALDEINDYSEKVGNFTWGFNTLLLTGTNYIQLPKILGSSRKNDKLLLGEIERDLSKPIGSQWYTPRPGLLQKTKGAAGLFFSKGEAFEEGAQFAIQTGTEAFFNRAYENKEDISSFWSNLASVFEGTMNEGIEKTLDSKEGLESILIGGLSGGIQQIRGNVKEQGFFGTGGERAKNTDIAVSSLNKTGTQQVLKDQIKYSAIGINSQRLRQEGIANNDVLSEKDYERDYALSYIMPRVKYGKTDSIYDEVDNYIQQSTSDEGFNELKSEGIVSEGETRESFIKRANSVKELAKNTEKIYSQINDRYSAYVDADGNRIFSDGVVDRMVYAASKVSDYDVRIPELNLSLLTASIDTQSVLEGIIENNEPSVEATKAALDKINSMNVISEEKDTLKRDLQDVIELSLRRKLFIDDYEGIRKNPSAYTEVDKVIDTEEPAIVKQQITPEGAKKKKTIEKEVEVGKEYSIKRIAKVEGDKLQVAPKLTVLSKTLGGEYEVRLPDGTTTFLKPEEFKAYELTEQEIDSKDFESIVDEAIDTVLRKKKYNKIAKPESNKVAYVNSLGNPQLLADIEKEVNAKSEEFFSKIAEEERLAKDAALNTALNETSDLGIQTRDTSSGGFEPNNKKTEQEVVDSTTPPVEGYSQKEPLAEHHVRANRFGANYYTFANRDNFRGVVVTQGNEKQLGIPGLMQWLKDKGKADAAVDSSKTIAMVVMGTDPITNERYFVGVDGKKLDKPTLDTIIYQTFPETLKWSTGESMFRDSIDEKTEIALTKDYMAWREQTLKNPTNDLYKISASFGTPQNVIASLDEKGKPIFDRTARIPVENSGLISETDLRTKRVVGVPTTDGAVVYGSSTFNDVKGVPLLYANNGLVRLNNRNISKPEAELIYNAIVKLANNLFTDKNLKSNESVMLYNWLKSVIYWGTPKDPQGNRKKAGVSSVFFEDGMLLMGKEEKKFSIKPSDLKKNKTAIIEELQTMYNNVNSTLVTGGQKGDWNKPYQEITAITPEGIETREWKNYQSFLLSAKNPDGSARNVPLATRIRPLKNAEDTNRKGIYFTLIDKKGNTSQEVPPVQPQKKVVIPATATEAKKTQPVKKFDLFGKENEIETKLGKFTFTVDKAKFEETNGKKGVMLPDPSSDPEYSVVLEAAIGKLSQMPKSGITEDTPNDDAIPIAENLIRSIIASEIKKQLAPASVETKPLTVNTAKQIEESILANQLIDNVVDRLKDVKDIVGAFDWVLGNFPASLIAQFTQGDIAARDQLLSQVRSFIKQAAPVSTDAKADIERRRREDKQFVKEYLLSHTAPEYIPLASLKGIKHPNQTIANGWIDRYYNAELAALEGAKPAVSRSLQDRINQRKQTGSTKRGSDFRMMLAEDLKKLKPENWAKVEAFLKSAYPNIPVYRVKNYILAANGRRAHGMFQDGAIYLSKNAEVGTIYHEVFHAIWQALTNPNERTNIRNEFTSREGMFFDRVNLKNVKYSEATEKQMEEKLAEELRDYFQEGKIPQKPAKVKQSWIAKLFSDIANFFRTFFTGENAKSNTEKLFEKIGSGYFKQATPYDSPLSFAKQGFIDIEDVVGGELADYSLDSFTGEQVHDLMQHMTYIVVRDLFEENKGLFEITKITREEEYKKLQDELGDLMAENIVEVNKMADENETTTADADIMIDHYNNLYENIINNWDSLVEKHEEYLKSYGIEFDENDEIDFNSLEKGKDDPYGDARKMDNMRKTNAAVKLLLASLPVVQTDGSEKLSSIGGYTLLPMSEMFMGTINNVHTSRSMTEMLNRVKVMANDDPKYIKLYNRLSKLKNIDEIDNAADLQLLSAFWRSFKKQSPTVKTVYVLDNGDVQVGDANFTTAARQVKDEFINSIKDKVAKGSKYFKKAENGKSYIGNADAIKDAKLDSLEAQVSFMNELGIEFDLDRLSIMPEKSQFSTAVNGIRSSIANSKSIISIGGRTLDIELRLRQLSEIKAKMDNPEFSSTYYNVNGELTQTFIGTNAASDLYDMLSQIDNLNDLSGTQYEYLLTDSFAKNSVLLYKMFDKDSGIRIEGTEELMGTAYADGTVNQVTGKQKESSKLNYKERLVQELNLNLAGYYLNLIPGDAAIEHMMYMGNTVDKSDILGNYKRAHTIFRGYLEDEISLAKDKNRRVAKGKKADELRFFKGILGEKLQADVLSFEGSIEEMYKEYGDDINSAIDKFINSEREKLKSSLIEYNVLTMEDNKFKAQGLSFGKEALSEDELNNELAALSINYAINNIELHKLLYSDPYQYSEELKRIKSFLSPRQAIINSSPEMNTAFHKVWNEGFDEGDVAHTNFERDYFRGATVADINATIDLKDYGVWEETDGGGIISLKALRNFKIRASEWDSDQEKQYKYDMAWEKQDKGGKLNRRERKALAAGNPKVMRTYTPIKPIVSGNKANGRNFNDVVLDKFALYPFSYRILKEINPTANGIKLYDKMQAEDVDYVVFKSGRKVGAEKTFSLYDKDGNFNDEPFETEEQKNDINVPQTVLNIPFAIMSIQSDVPSKEENIVTRGSQMTKLATLDFMAAGVPIDFKPEIKSFTERYNAWYDLDEAQQLKESELYKEIKNNQDILEALVEEGVHALTNEFGLTKVEGGYKIDSLDKVADALKNEITKREVNDNISAALKGYKSGAVILEATPAYQQIRNILYSIADRNVMSPKMSGGMKVQIPSTLLESTRKVKDGIYTSDVLGFYEKDGERVCEIMVARWFKSDLTDDELIEQFKNSELLKGIGFRIPTQKQNSIDSFVIKRFLPEEFGDAVVIPSALVKKVGSDFDIDKLNVYLKNVDVNKTTGEVRLIPYQGTGEEIRNRFKKRSDYKKSLENGYIESLQKLTSHPLNFDNLIKPNSADQMKGLSKEIVAKLGLGSFDYNVASNMLSRRFMSRLRHAFVTGKYAIGIAAVNQTNHSLNQRAPIYIDFEGRMGNLSLQDRKFLGDGKINFNEYNSIEIGGKSYPTVSMIQNAKEKNPDNISDILGQFIDGYVDISKDTWIMELGATPNVASTWMFLIKVGVPVESVAYFMNQPIVREYLRELEKKGSTWLFNDRLRKNIDKKYKGSSNLKISTVPSNERLLDMIGKTFVETPGKQTLTSSQIAEQKFILREFLKYAKMGEQLFYVTQGTNFDTASFNDPFLIFKKLYQLDKARNTVFASTVGGKTLSAADAILENSFLGKLKDGAIDVRQALSEILLSDRKGTIRETVQNVLKTYVKMNDRDFVKTSQRVVATLFDWATQTQKGWNSDIQDVLISKEKNVAKRVNDFIAPIKKNPAHPLYNNHIIKTLTPDFADGEQEVNNLKFKNKPNKVYDQNQIIYAFKEIKNYLKSEGNEALYDDLVKLSVLQSGLTQSTVSFTNLLPYDDFLNVYNDVLADLPIMSIKEFKDLNVFERTFWNYDDVVPHMEAEYRVDWMTGFTEYNTNMMFKPEVYNAMKAKELPILLKLPISAEETNYDVIVYTYEKQIPAKQKREMRQRGDYSYVNKGLFKKVGMVDGGSGNKVFIYKAINAWGDGIFAKEFYNIAQKSVIDNGFNESDETITDDIILSYFGTVPAIAPIVDEEVTSFIEETPVTEIAPKSVIVNNDVIEEKPVDEKDIDKVTKDTLIKNNLEPNEVKVVEINGKQRVINISNVPAKVKRGYSKFYSKTSNDIYFIERYGKKIVVPGFEDLNLVIDQESNFVYELSTGQYILTNSSTQKGIKEELETLFKEKDFRTVLTKSKKIDINDAILNITYPTFNDSFSSERQKEIVTNFASKHKLSEEKALEYINNAIATKGQEVIDKLNECY